MIQNLVLRNRPTTQLSVEVIERKGVGHPDTICDALSENLTPISPMCFNAWSMTIPQIG